MMCRKGKVKAGIILGAFLDIFADVKDYCKKMYLIDKELVDALIQNGKDTIENKMDTRKRYCELAIEYWKQREEEMKKFIPEDDQWYLYENIDVDKYQ